MKTYVIDIAPQLRNVTITVKNGKRFSDYLIKGHYGNFYVYVAQEDLSRVKKFAVKYGNDKGSNRGNWYAHCNGFAMDLCITNAGKYISITTARYYGRTRPD